jgi:hypothetical protein
VPVDCPITSLVENANVLAVRMNSGYFMNFIHFAVHAAEHLAAHQSPDVHSLMARKAIGSIDLRVRSK